MKRSLNFASKQPILYLVATPIGNLKEVSFRTIEVLSSVDLIVCEDTRVTARLLNKYKIEKPLLYMEKHNEVALSKKIINEIIQNGNSVAYVSDAGYPCISDPGQILVETALINGINVSTISGPSAFLNALVASGLDSSRFYFHGFLEVKEKSKINELRELFKRKETLIFYEAPHRLLKTLETLNKVFGARKACIARELTKKHEEYIRGNLDELVAMENLPTKGEFVILVEGYNDEMQPHLDGETIRLMVNQMMEMGVSTKDAIKQVAKTTKLNKNYIYKIYHTN